MYNTKNEIKRWIFRKLYLISWGVPLMCVLSCRSVARVLKNSVEKWIFTIEKKWLMICSTWFCNRIFHFLFFWIKKKKIHCYLGFSRNWFLHYFQNLATPQALGWLKSYQKSSAKTKITIVFLLQIFEGGGEIRKLKNKGIFIGEHHPTQRSLTKENWK